MARGRWLKPLRYLLVAVGAGLVIAALTKLIFVIDHRRTRGALIADTENAVWIAASDRMVVIGLRGSRDGTYRVMRVDPSTMQSSELQAGEGDLQAVAYDRDWLYWSIYGGGSRTYVLPLSGGPIRKVADKCARSIGLGAGRVYFSIRGDETSQSDNDDDIWTGKLGDGPERKVTQPQPSGTMVDLINGIVPPARVFDEIVVDDSQAVWITYGFYQYRPPTEASMERVRHDSSEVVKFQPACGRVVPMLHGDAGTYFVCGELGQQKVTLQPKDGGPERVLYTLKKAKAMREYGTYLYLEALQDTPDGEETCLTRVPVAGGPAERVVRIGSAPFAIGAGRIWYMHYEGIASLPLER